MNGTLTPYRQTLARLRAECAECADGTSRPEHVGQLSWHEWGHRLDGAPDTAHPHCTCGTELRNSPRIWHCGGCHETFAGEKPFMRHRRGDGSARYCLNLRNGGPSRHWSDTQGLWHYGPRYESEGTHWTSGAPVPDADEVAAA